MTTKTTEIIRLNLSLSYVEPGEHGEPVTTTRTCDEVLALQAELYIAANRKRSDRNLLRINATEEQMVDDYIVVHWAKVPEVEGIQTDV